MSNQTTVRCTLPFLDEPTLERFWANVETVGDCWMWRGPTAYGHPQAHLRRYEPRRIRVRAYVVAWEIEHGPFTGRLLLSECGNDLCVRPLHRSPGTIGDLERNSDETRAAAFWARSQPQENGCVLWGVGPPDKHRSTSWHGRHLAAHRLAWELTNGPIPDGMFICHECDNPPCINVDHLFLGWPADNSADMVRKGRSYRAVGTAHHLSKLTADQVVEIRRRYHQDRTPAYVLAPQYGVTTMTIWKAATGGTYSDLPMPEVTR